VVNQEEQGGGGVGGGQGATSSDQPESSVYTKYKNIILSHCTCYTRGSDFCGHTQGW
jgi:hypothetical protein